MAVKRVGEASGDTERHECGWKDFKIRRSGRTEGFLAALRLPEGVDRIYAIMGSVRAHKAYDLLPFSLAHLLFLTMFPARLAVEVVAGVGLQLRVTEP